MMSATLTWPELAREYRERERAALKDKTYRSTPLGLEVAAFMRYFKNEYGATAESYRDYEAILAKLCLDHADLELHDFEPPVGTQRLREFIERRWSDRSPRTRKKVRAVLMSFFRWAQGEFKLQGNPVTAIRTPRVRDPERPTFTEDDQIAVIAAQEGLRDRVAVKLLLLMGLRKGELAAIQLRDFDLGHRRLTIRGKGGKIRKTPIPTEELRREIERLILGRDPREYLLYPTKMGRTGTWPNYETKVVWENRLAPLSSTAMHRWWYGCLRRANLVGKGVSSGKKMHSARYTAGTEFYLATGDIYATQKLLGHVDVGTTANIYVQESDADLEEKLRRTHGD
jgi:integrase/recombinase XerD